MVQCLTKEGEVLIPFDHTSACRCEDARTYQAPETQPVSCNAIIPCQWLC
jgi:hypothetical protein